MRIGLVIYGDLQTLSGGYLYDRKLVEYLRAQGDTVEIISLPWRSYAAHLTDNLSAKWLARLLSLKVDVLIQDELNHPSLFQLNYRLKKETAIPLVSIVHHLRISEQHPAIWMPLYRLVERRYLASLDAFIFNSLTTRRVVEDLGFPPKPSVVAQPAGDRLPWQISEAQIEARAKEDGPLRLLFLGNLIPRKGLHLLLIALETLSRDSWHLTVVGKLDAAGNYGTALVRRVADLGWQGQVRFTGAVRDERMIDILAGCQALVLPSQYEGYGIAYLEGMAMGLPAIGTTSDAAGEIITDGLDGFLVEAGDAQALAEPIRRLHLNRPLLVQLGLNARKRFLDHPTWEDSMAKCYDFIHSV
jgi:glycosyltransferase involved in cell wall biosynthesis